MGERSVAAEGIFEGRAPIREAIKVVPNKKYVEEVPRVASKRFVLKQKDLVNS